MTFEEIMERLLERVPDTFDKREGSVIWDALSPAAYELSLAYEDMEAKRRNTFAGTADREGLIECCKEIGTCHVCYTSGNLYSVGLGSCHW